MVTDLMTCTISLPLWQFPQQFAMTEAQYVAPEGTGYSSPWLFCRERNDGNWWKKAPWVLELTRKAFVFIYRWTAFESWMYYQTPAACLFMLPPQNCSSHQYWVRCQKGHFYEKFVVFLVDNDSRRNSCWHGFKKDVSTVVIDAEHFRSIFSCQGNRMHPFLEFKPCNPSVRDRINHKYCNKIRATLLGDNL